MVAEDVCLLVVLIGRLGRRGTGLVGMLNEVPAAVEHWFDPPAVQCESVTPPGLLEEDGLVFGSLQTGPRRGDAPNKHSPRAGLARPPHAFRLTFLTPRRQDCQKLPPS